MSSPSAALRFQDLSWRRRCGCKGPAAEVFLASQGYRVPAEPNSAALDAGGVLVARLPSSEFLIEAVAGPTPRLAALRSQLHERRTPSGVYPVARQDLVLELGGEGLNVLLRQTCSVDFAPLFEQAQSDGGPIVLTSMIGVGVVAWPRRVADGPAVTLWSDPSFAHYFYNTLLEVGRDQGGVTINRAERASATGSDT